MVLSMFSDCAMMKEGFSVLSPKLTALERSILHAEAFGEKSEDSLDNPASITFLWNIQQDVCKLRYMPPKKKTVTLDIPFLPR